MMPFAPVLDEDSLPLDPLDAVRAGVGADVELLLGSNTDEHRFFLVPPGLIDQLDDGFVDAALADLRRAPASTCGRRYDERYSTAGELFAAAASDFFFRLPDIRLAEARGNGAARTWMYEFAWRSPLYAGRLGACHYLEVPFVFDTLDTPSAALVTGAAPPQQIADDMHRRWLEFAAAGDPGWPPLHARAPRGHDLRPRERRGRRPALRAAGRVARAELTPASDEPGAARS